MKPKSLSRNMTIAEFENGYWYAIELRQFAKTLGANGTSKLRKDELEEIITSFLRTGQLGPSPRQSSENNVRKDVDVGLSADLPVRNYSDIRETKQFIDTLAKRLAPGFKPKSGARYRLNRWREEQLARGKAITYGDLANKYRELCATKGRFPPVPTGRYINFLADYLSAVPGSSHKQARDAWAKLKKLDIPKDYRSWEEHQNRKSRNGQAKKVDDS